MLSTCTKMNMSFESPLDRKHFKISNAYLIILSCYKISWFSNSICFLILKFLNIEEQLHSKIIRTDALLLQTHLLTAALLCPEVLE